MPNRIRKLGRWIDKNAVPLAAIAAVPFTGGLSAALAPSLGLLAPVAAGAVYGGGAGALVSGLKGQDIGRGLRRGAMIGGAGGLTKGLLGYAGEVLDPEISSALADAGATETVGVAENVARLTPSALESGIGTPGYGVNAAALDSGFFEPSVVGAGATVPLLEASPALTPAPLTPAAIEAAIGTPGYGVNAAALESGVTASPGFEGMAPVGMSGAQTSTYDAVINATGSPAVADAAATVTGTGGDVYEWLKANPAMGKALFTGLGALANTAGGGSNNAGYVDSGYRPTISRGGWNPSPQARQMPLAPVGLLAAPKGYENSGLWRYGLLGG